MSLRRAANSLTAVQHALKTDAYAVVGQVSPMPTEWEESAVRSYPAPSLPLVPFTSRKKPLSGRSAKMYNPARESIDANYRTSRQKFLIETY